MSTSVYDHVGGMPFFVTLVDRFYDGVEADDTIRPLYPEDLEPGKQALALFLAQYWGAAGIPMCFDGCAPCCRFCPPDRMNL